MNKYKIHLSLLSLLILSFSLLYFLVFQQIYTDYYKSDINEHITYLYQYFYAENVNYAPHLLWHYGVKITSDLLNISIENSAIIFSAFLVTLWTYLVYSVVQDKLIMLNSYTLILITLSIIIIGPLCIPWYNKIIFMGQGSPNIWHNVTLWSVKPLALLSIIFLFKAVYTKSNLYYFLTTITVITSLFAKPSFAIMFLPSLAIFGLIKKYYNRQFILFYILLSLLSISILLYQFSHTFNTGDSKVIFDFLGVWSQASKDVSISILLALAFPLLFVLLESRTLHDDYILFSWIQIFMGIFFYSLLAQTGHYYNHGNFGWSYMIAMSILYVFSIMKFFEIYKSLNIFKRYILLSLLLTQVIIGIYYFEKVLQGQNPLYISIFL